MVRKQTNEFEWFWSRLNEYLAKAKLKHSKQRNQVIEYFIEMNDHVAAEELHQYAKEQDCNAGMATIYRTLNLLKDAGLVEQKQFADGRAVFELNKPNQHHDHLICTTCSRVIEFENDKIEMLQEEIAATYGIKLTHHSLDLFGVCQVKNCQYKKS